MSTHHPSPAVLNSGVLDPLLEAIGRNMGDYDNPNVIISNNGYFDDNNVDGLRTADLIQRRCEDKFKFTPVIVMGEYNYDRGLTSEHGPNAEGMSAEVLSAKLNARYNEQLRGKRVLVYCIGIGQDKKVKNFHMDNDTAKLVAQNAPRFEKPPMVAQPNPPPETAPENPVPALPPQTDPVWQDATLRGGEKMNLRDAPFYKTAQGHVPGKVLVSVPDSSDIKVWLEPNYEADGLRWFGVTYQAHIGWMAVLESNTPEQQFTLDKEVPPPQEEPNDPPIEEPPVEDDDTQPAPPVTDHVHTADFVKVLKSQYKAMTLYNDNLKAQMEALDLQAQQAQSSLLELEALIEAYAPKEAA
jgi:hypothetical protein